MGRPARMLMVVVLLLSSMTAVADATGSHGAPLPKRARPLEDGRYASPMGFRDTVEWYRKELRRRGLNVETLPARKYRDVVYVRIVAKDTGLGWTAIHIVLAEGKTSIYVVAAFAAADGTKPREAL